MSAEESAEALQYLTFKLGEETFALVVAQVREVLDLTPITRVPNAPDFMRCMINVRGNVVSVIDMRLKFGMTKTENTLKSRISDEFIILLDVERIISTNELLIVQETSDSNVSGDDMLRDDDAAMAG